MTVLNLLLTTTQGLPANTVISDRNTTLKNIKNLYKALSAGALASPSVLIARVAPVYASGTITLSSASGTLTATINGVSVTSSGAGTDTADAVAMAVAINASADALISGLVTATSALGVVTITAVNPGKSGNAITTAGSGTGVTADQARLVGGTNGTQTSFTI